MQLLFFSWHGLGNSIINFPILHALRRKNPVKVICFNNGSSAFFNTFHDDVVAVNSKWEMLKQARAQRADALYVCYPTWKRELATQALSPSTEKYALRCADVWAPPFLRFRGEGDPTLHHLENNLRLFSGVRGYEDVNSAQVFDLRQALRLEPPSAGSIRRLAVHPTASTEAKYYPLEFWRQLLSGLSGDFDEFMLFCGGHPTEVAFCQAITAGLDQAVAARTHRFAGLGFAQLSTRIDSAAYFIGSDSALMHLAALMDKPTLGLWSFANYRVIFPYGNQAKIYLPKETLSAQSHEYPNQAAPYLKRASVQTVIGIVQESETASFAIKAKYKNEVRVYAY